jgi:hypothetical protein
MTDKKQLVDLLTKFGIVHYEEGGEICVELNSKTIKPPGDNDGSGVVVFGFKDDATDFEYLSFFMDAVPQ